MEKVSLSCLFYPVSAERGQETATADADADAAAAADGQLRRLATVPPAPDGGGEEEFEVLRLGLRQLACRKRVCGCQRSREEESRSASAGLWE